MNQKSLIITIIAVIAAIVVIGLWLTGAAGFGPLAGCTNCVAAPQTTTLTLSVWVYNENTGNENEREIVFQGDLTTGDYPVIGRTVTISTGGNTTATVTTGPSGRFDAIYTEADGSHSYVAVFAGDDRYVSSQSSPVSSP